MATSPWDHYKHSYDFRIKYKNNNVNIKKSIHKNDKPNNINKNNIFGTCLKKYKKKMAT